MSDFTKLNRLERVAALNRASLQAKSVWSVLHHALDRRGRVELGGATFEHVLVLRLAVPTPERQWFYAKLRELQALGVIEVEGDVMILHGHAGSHDPREKPARKIRPTSNQPAPDLLATSGGPSPDLPPTFPRPSPDLRPTSDQAAPDLRSGTDENHSASAPRARQIREEEKRLEERKGEGEESAGAREPSPHADGDSGRALASPGCRLPIVLVPDSRGADAFARSMQPKGADYDRTAAIVSETRVAAGGFAFTPSGHSDTDAVHKLTIWAAKQSTPDSTLRAVLVAFWAKKGTQAALRWLADEDPGRWLGKEQSARRAVMPGIATHADHARAVAAAGGIDGIAEERI